MTLSVRVCRLTSYCISVGPLSLTMSQLGHSVMNCIGLNCYIIYLNYFCRNSSCNIQKRVDRITPVLNVVPFSTQLHYNNSLRSYNVSEAVQTLYINLLEHYSLFISHGSCCNILSKRVIYVLSTLNQPVFPWFAYCAFLLYFLYIPRGTNVSFCVLCLTQRTHLWTGIVRVFTYHIIRVRRSTQET